jgi:hypothetical protein
MYQVDGPGQLSILFPPFYLKTQADSSFRDVEVLLLYNSDVGQSPKEQLYVLKLKAFFFIQIIHM